MHELSLASAIVETAIRHARGRTVTAVQLRVGALRQVVEESLVFYFGIVSRDTVCDGARLEVESVGALMGCGSCGQQWDPAPDPAHEQAALIALPQFRCPACGESGAKVLAGEELLVDSIEVEEDSGGARAPLTASDSQIAGG